MQQTLVTKHLKQKLDLLLLPLEKKEKIVQKNNEITQNIYNLLANKELTILGIPKSVSPLISKIQKKEIANFYLQDQILLKRKKEAEKLKTELKEKLNAINTSIDYINNVEQTQLKGSQTVYDERVQRIKETREKFMKKQDQVQTEQDQKRIEEQTKQWQKEQKQREKIKEQLMKENQKKLDEQMKLNEEQKRQQKELEKEEKLNKLKQQHIQLIKRKQEREEMKQKAQEYMQIYGKKQPLFVELNQKFEQEILMPELEKRKEELKKRRDLFTSVTFDDIKKHSEKYQMTNQEMQERRQRERKEYELEIKTSQNIYSSNILKDVIAQEKIQKQEEEKKLKEKLDLVQKRMKYAELVKSTQLPTPSSKKQEEMEQIKNRIKTIPRQPKMKEIKEEANKLKWHSKENQKVKDKDGNWRELNTREKKRIQSLTPKAKPVSQPQIPVPNSAKYQNYLQEIKRQKEEQGKPEKLKSNKSLREFQTVLQNPALDNFQKFEQVKKKVDQLENAANWQQLKMNHIKEANKRSLQQNQQVNSMYIDSIKAKLALLEGLQQ